MLSACLFTFSELRMRIELEVGMALTEENKKLVILGLPWDIDTEGLKKYMSKFGAIDDIVVMKERGSGRSRGFGYVTFSSLESTEKALDSKHIINGRLLDVKVATPKKDMKPSKKITRIFVARLSSKVVEEEFHRYFEQFGTITDLYMPKDSGAKGHRGIGFITFENPEAVEKIMSQSHELGGQTLAIDQATPKNDLPRHSDKGSNLEKHSHSTGPYGAYSPYITASASQLGPYGMSSYGSYDYPGRGPSSDYPPSSLSSAYGVNSWSTPRMGTSGLPGPYGSSGYGPSDHFPGSASKSQGNKVFVGKLPSEVTTGEVRRYFSNFGLIMDIYLPKDSKKTGGHRGIAFVSFADEITANRVCCRSHELFGQLLVVERATPEDEVAGVAGGPRQYDAPSPALLGTSGGSIRDSGSAYYSSSYRSSLDYDGWRSYGGSGYDSSALDGGAFGGSRSSRMENRYRPY